MYTEPEFTKLQNEIEAFGILTKSKDHWYPGLLPLKTVYELSLPNNLRKAS